MHAVIVALTVFTLVLSNGAVSIADMGAAAPLSVASGSPAASHNQEGIEHYKQGHWDVAKEHFVAAAKADPQAAEVHYNVALVLDKMGDHEGATEHFKMAKDLGKKNPEIQNSPILKAHLKAK